MNARFAAFAASTPVAFAALLGSVVSIQLGASLAKTLFPLVGAWGATTLRLLTATIILFAVLRPWRHPVARSEWRPILLYGLSMGFMNIFFYQAIERVPLGVAVALEFTGPLAVSLCTSRRWTDFCSVGLAVLGLGLLLPLRRAVDGVDPLGAVYSLLAGLCWGLYIVFGKRAGKGGSAAAVSLGMLVAACLAFPMGVAEKGLALFAPSLLPLALLLGLLSSAVPYALEMVGLKRLPAHTFSILMSMEPAVAALSGFLFLGERLDLTQWFALACVMAASVSVTFGMRRARPSCRAGGDQLE